MLAENRFLAARDGIDARLIDSQARCLIPVREILDSLLADCRDPALKLGALMLSIGCSASRPQTGPNVNARSWSAAGVSTTWS